MYQNLLHLDPPVTKKTQIQNFMTFRYYFCGFSELITLIIIEIAFYDIYKISVANGPQVNKLYNPI